MVFIHEKEANSILPKSGLKHPVAVTPSIDSESHPSRTCKTLGRAVAQW